MAIEELQQKWNTLYRQTLPQLAKAKASSQPKWPVQLDHCFARIILDHVIGKGEKPWNQVIKAPAYKNMSESQLDDAIRFGEDIAKGEADLVKYDEESLRARGKSSKVREVKKETPEDEIDSQGRSTRASKRKSRPSERSPTPTKTRKTNKDGKVSFYFSPVPPVDSQARTSDQQSSTATTTRSTGTLTNPITNATYPDLSPLSLIAESNLTPFRKQVLSLLCQVPRGKYTTYQALADHISDNNNNNNNNSGTSQGGGGGGRTCARAVGNAMRNNPFAPAVPCHRVLATGGRIGGFGGEWGDNGRFAEEKVRLLRSEGVRFGTDGKVVGGVWRGFK